ncbi:MAG: CPBP family intramembrane glutamic endopeptidase [Planctomycetota bacterium]
MTVRRGRIGERSRTSRPGLAEPLEALVFLLPLIIFSEVASRLLSSDGTVPQQGRVVAFHLLRFLFELFGATGTLMPALAVVLLLLGTQAVSGQPWRVRKSAVALIYLEAPVLAVPLLVIHHWVRLAGGRAVDGWAGEAALGIGAGIYEELIFRLVLISVITAIGSDWWGRSETFVLPVAVFLSALLFAAHHHPPVGRDPFDVDRFLFRTLAGIYLGTVFVMRGYGVAAGTHAAYNLIVLWRE